MPQIKWGTGIGLVEGGEKVEVEVEVANK